MNLPLTKEPHLTQLLQAWSSGDQTAFEQLYPLVERELRSLASRYFEGEGPEHSLPTPDDLVNETLLRLLERKPIEYRSPAHFFTVVAHIMRRTLIDYARRRRPKQRVTFSYIENELQQQQGVELLALDEALNKLAKEHPRESKIVVLHFFVGLTRQEIAEMLHISQVTVGRDLLFGQAWLRSELSQQERIDQAVPLSNEKLVGQGRQWHLEELFRAVLETKSNERAAFIAQACAGDDKLRQMVESLVAVQEMSARFLDPTSRKIAAEILIGGGVNIEDEQVLADYLAAIDQIRNAIQQDQIEIEKLKLETRNILATL